MFSLNKLYVVKKISIAVNSANTDAKMLVGSISTALLLLLELKCMNAVIMNAI